MVTRIVVDNRVRVYGALPEEIGKKLKAAFDHVNPKRQQLEAMGFPAWKQPRVISSWRQEQDHLSFARGSYRRVRAILSEELVVRVSDRRCEGESAAGEREIPEYGRPLWPHQDRAVHALIDKENCLLRAPTGCGKTGIALAIVAELKVPSLIVVPNGSLYDQWIERCMDPKELGLRARDVGMIRGKKRTIKPVTVAMQKTLAEHGIDEELRASFGLLVEDEVQFAPASTFFNAIDPFPARWRLGVSNDERRKDKMDFLTRDLFGDVGCEITREEVERGGHIMDVEIRVVPSKFEAAWWDPAEEGLDELLEEGGPSLAEKEAEEQKLKQSRFRRLLNELMADAEREALIDRIVVGEVKEGRQVIVFTRRREHVLAIDQRLSARGIKTGIMLGGVGEDQRVKRETIAGIKAGEIRVGVGTIEAVGTGVDLPSVEVGVLALPIFGNPQLFGQVRGRICRGNKGKLEPVSRLYVIDDERVVSSLSMLVRGNKTVSVLEGGRWVQQKKRR